MEKRAFTVIMTLMLLMSFASYDACAVTQPIEDKAVYYTEESDYMDGDCVLTAAKVMIKRALILNGRDGWKEITNETLRPSATMDGLMMYSFDFDAGGLSFKISCGSFSGEGDAARVREFEKLLKAHPEGVVVHGEFAASTGTHGVLLVDVVNGVPYAADSSYNMGMFSEGIQKWTDTTMLEPGLVTDYWYISRVGNAPKKMSEMLRKRQYSEYYS